MTYGLNPNVPAVDVRSAFEAGDFDYLPNLVPEMGYSQLERHWLIESGYPSDECIADMSNAAVEDLAEKNLQKLAQIKGRRRPAEISLFAAVGVKRGLELYSHDVGYIAVKQALVVPHSQISGRIGGPNRRMLDLIYSELGVKGEPEVEEPKIVPATQFGGPLIKPGQGVEDMGTPGQKLTRSKYRTSFKGSGRVSTAMRRAKFVETEIVFDTGQVDSVVRLEY